MPADYIVKQGDAAPSYSQTLAYSDGTVVDLTGATVAFEMRSLASTIPVTITGTVTVLDETAGQIYYTPSVADTAIAGNYMASWSVTFSGGTEMTFPTDGYLWVEIQPSISSEPQQLVSLPDVKQWLREDAGQRDYDDELRTLIEAVRPMVEAITGPILPVIYNEWYDGGTTTISLRHRPSSGSGTSPILNVIAASEYIGPIEWPLALIPSPDLGQIYSAMLNPAAGTLTRRTAGGGISGFQGGRDQVHVIYQSGQTVVPANVQLAVKELVRVNFRGTAAVGKGLEALADQGDTGTYTAGFWFPREIQRMLAPTRKFPSFA